MSAYIVEDVVINAIVGYLRTDRDGAWLRHRIKEAGFDLEDKTQAGCIALGQALYNLNHRACGIRYPGSDELPGEGAIPYIYRRMSAIERIPALKALHCLKYQCSEGDAVHDPIYKLLEDIEISWMCKIVRALPAYDRAAWGYEDTGAISIMDLGK